MALMFSVGDRCIRVVVSAAIVGLLMLVGGCSGIEKALTAGDAKEDAADAVLSADLTSRQPALTNNRLPEAPTPASQIYGGSRDDFPIGAQGGGERPPAAPGEEVTRTSDGYDINFQNADINAVSKVILGDLLKLTYSVDPRVQGTLSLSSGRPIARQDLMPMFESALKIVNANIVQEGGLYKVVPIGEALGNGVVDRSVAATPGYGITVLPLRYVSAQTVLRAIDSFAAKPGQARVEPTRNLLLVQGTGAERASAIEAAMALDVDWMKNQSVGIFPVRNASPDTIIAELRNVFDAGREGAGAHIVRFQAINRLNAVLAVGNSSSQMNTVKTWVARLDRADYDNTTVRVYKLRYGNAKVIAAILKDVFTGQGGGAGALGNSDLSQLTPGSGALRATNPGQTGSQSGTSTSTTTTTQQRTLNTPAFGGGDSADQGGIGTGRSDSTTERTSRQGVDLASLSTGGANSGQAPLPNVRITADLSNNSLLIYASRDQYKMVERAIFELDRAPLQVAIDVTIAEITLKDDLQYGVQYFLQNYRAPTRPGRGATESSSIGFGASDPLKRLIPGANFVLGTNDDPKIVLSALKTVTDVKVLSAPALDVLDNQPAILQVGDQVPIITQQATAVITPGAPTVNSIERHDTGVILKVIPRVNANGVVNLDVSQEVSAVATNDPSLGPTISQRKVQSTVAVASGQTVLLGGLISSNQNNTRNGIPILSDLKGVGDLFATTEKKNERTELIVFIRPQIIRNGTDAQLVAEELRSKLQTLARGASRPDRNDSKSIFRDR
jgi:general secretion pathway protein D